MRSSARVLANRRNARRSTGPKTSEGKSRGANNALRHRLAIPVTINPALVAAAERLARVIAGKDVDPIRLGGARRIAEAQIDLLRARRARLALLNSSGAWAKERSVQLIRTREQLETEESLAEGLEDVAAGLARLDHHERRALSRRKFAIREFDEWASSQGSLSHDQRARSHLIR